MVNGTITVSSININSPVNKLLISIFAWISIVSIQTCIVSSGIVYCHIESGISTNVTVIFKHLKHEKEGGATIVIITYFQFKSLHTGCRCRINL